MLRWRHFYKASQRQSGSHQKKSRKTFQPFLNWRTLVGMRAMVLLGRNRFFLQIVSLTVIFFQKGVVDLDTDIF